MLGKDEGKGKDSEKSIFMWGYLPAASQQRAPLLLPTPVPRSATQEPWKDVCAGGCGFALAISESGKLNTWGSTDDLGQSYLTSGKHEEIPEPFPLETDAAIVKAAAGWAHCIAVTDRGEVFTWGWKECVPSLKANVVDQVASASANLENENLNGQTESLKDQGIRSKSAASGLFQSERMGGASSSMKQNPVRSIQKAGAGSNAASYDQSGDDGIKRRRIGTTKQGNTTESSAAGDESVSAPPCLVSLRPGIKVVTVAAGGRHTLALTDTGQVWGWGYGGEGQLGLGSRIRTVSSPHPIPCFGTSSQWKELQPAVTKGNKASEGQSVKVPGSYVKAIACGGRHSAIITDAGALLTFGWGLYGQCGQGCTEDELSPAYVSALAGLHIQGIAAGLWHTVCITATGEVYAFGGNQFGQLGTGGDQAEMLPRLLEASNLESEHAKTISCGARHTAICTESGKVFCWGWNKYGQLGLADAIDRNVPCEVSLENYFVTNVACGWWHTLASANHK
eukprot:TRINITY_DN10723_c0_g1_i2.p1 TRINITY_DN10723_c0_g1~~TRINITY_DN10723_c0_g1_i2.p1  ORF type:complete len:508 (+),score=111.39 TRINITY_DN10723_c0_g1_i2:348-1871(+)